MGVNIDLFRSLVPRVGARPSVPPVLDGENNNPLNPEGSDGSPSIPAPDSNKVSYNQADNKNATERNQARVNIGSTSATPQVIATAGAINNLAITSNNLVFTGANVVLSGIVAGQDGEEITILNTNSTVLSIINQSSLSDANNRIIGALLVPQNSVVRLKYRATTNRWLIEALIAFDSRYVRKDVPDTKTDILIVNGLSTNSGNNVFEVQILTDPFFRITGNKRATFFGSSTNQNNAILRVFNSLASGDLIEGRDNLDNRVFIVRASGRVIHSRSGASNESTRRDELHLNYNQTIATSGQIDNLAINADTKLLILTQADELTGIDMENNRLIRIEVRSSSVVIRHESVSSIAANRFALPGGSDLTIQQNEIVTFIKTNNRIRRVI